MALPGVYKEFNERWCKQTVWIYSDPHFGDTELAAGTPNRPSAEEQVKTKSLYSFNLSNALLNVCKTSPQPSCQRQSQTGSMCEFPIKKILGI